MSADGKVLGYCGPGGKAGTDAQGPYLIDGTTGDVIRTFDKEYSFVSPVLVSGDGRRAALMRSFIGDSGVAMIDVVDTATGTVVGRAALDTRRSHPPFHLTHDGKSLLIQDTKDGKLHMFVLPAGAGAGMPPAAPK
jgi:hypothetical protein